MLSTLPAPGDSLESQIRFSLLVATDLAEAELAARIEFPGATVRTRARGTRRGRRSPAASAPRPRAAAAARRRRASRESAKSGGGDLTRARVAQVDQRHGARRHPQARRPDEPGRRARDPARRDRRPDRAPGAAPASRRGIGGEFAKVHKALDRKLRELQSAVLEVRMVPLRQVFEKVSRVVRRLRRELGKQVELEIRGADTELDKLIVEALVDPLMHVVRNALDHAIEPADERRAQLARTSRADLDRGVPARQPRGDRGARRRPRDRPRRRCAAAPSSSVWSSTARCSRRRRRST